MGVYIYTRRKDVREIDGLKIVRFSYAYKPGGYRYNDSSVEKRLLAAGERAAKATADVEYFFMGQWPDIKGSEEVAFYPVGPSVSAVVDDAPRTPVGYIFRQGKKLCVRMRDIDIE